MADVSDEPIEIQSAAVKTLSPVAFLDLGNPLVTTINHASGYVLGGLRVHQTGSGTTISEDRTYRYYIHRHPNCDHIDVFMSVNMATPNAPFTIAVAAGSGASASITVPIVRTFGIGTAMYTIRAPWGAADTGIQGVVITCTNVAAASLMICDVPRASLVSGDDKLEYYRSTSLRCRIQEGGAIASSADGSIYASIAVIEKIWTNFHRQAFAWSVGSSTDRYTIAPGGGYVNVFDSGTALTFKHRARQKKSTSSTVNYTCYYRTWTTAGGSYVFRVAVTNTGGTTNYDGASKSNTAEDWQTATTSIAVDCTADATIEFQISATSKAANLTAISMIES